MSDPLSISTQPPGAPGVRAAIAQASRRTGVDFDYLLAQARIESSLNPEARARTSSAAGLYQFTQGTWLETLERHGAEHGLGWAQAAISGGRVADPAMRAQIMALRHDPGTAAAMAAELASDNRDALVTRLGREPDSAELYLAHFLGIGGAGQMLSALDSNPGQSAVALLPAAAAANRSIFYDGAGAPRSVAGVMELIRSKVSAAMEGGAMDGGFPDAGAPAWAEADPAGPLAAAQGFRSGWEGFPAAAAGSATTASPPAPRPSMADTLRDTFGLGDPATRASAPGFVHEAYGALRSLGL